MTLWNQQQELKCLQEANILSFFYYCYSLGSIFQVWCYYVSPDRQQPRALALISDSVCAEDDSANLKPTEIANCVCLDSNALVWEIKRHKPVTVTGQCILWQSRDSQQAIPNCTYDVYCKSQLKKKRSRFQSCSLLIKLKSLL